VARTDIEISTSSLSDLEVEQASIVAARAFQNDPFFVHLTERPLLRSRGLALFFRAALKNLGPGGHIYTARRDGEIIGVAAWVEPEMYPSPAKEQAKQMLGSARAMMPRPRSLIVGLRYITAIEKAHPREPVWYLPLLVVDPSIQRSGVGRMLLAPTIELSDEQGIDTYLETQNEDNLAYYGRFGYGVVEVLNPVKKGPPLWTLRRASKGR
jgi:GNAT superfamily N-acetyltransferase